MNRKVIIERITTQCVDGQKDVNRVSYRGRCNLTPECATIQYMNVDEAGRVRTKLELQEDGCLLQNTGDMKRTMQFAPGRRTRTKMMLSVGCMEMDVVTHRYERNQWQGTEPHLHAVLAYDLYSGGALVASNTLDIHVSPAP